MISKKTLGMVCKVLNSKLGVGTACSSVNRIKKHGSSQKDSKKGFTLVELIVVLVIIAILAAVAVPALLGYIDYTKVQENFSFAQQAVKEIDSKALEMQQYMVDKEKQYKSLDTPLKKNERSKKELKKPRYLGEIITFNFCKDINLFLLLLKISSIISLILEYFNNISINWTFLFSLFSFKTFSDTSISENILIFFPSFLLLYFIK